MRGVTSRDIVCYGCDEEVFRADHDGDWVAALEAGWTVHRLAVKERRLGERFEFYYCVSCSKEVNPGAQT